jgi:UDP-N-acetylmuramyl pentapeptide synthase
MVFDYVGRHVGSFHGIEPTGQIVTAKVCIVATVGEQHIEREHIYYPLARMLEQLQG